MIALSIRQPWAWLIVHGLKDIENRDWPTKRRGEFLIHTGKSIDVHEYNYVRGVLSERNSGVRLPIPEHLPRGGIVGRAEIVDCVTESASRWFFGKYGFVLNNAKALPFVPWRGQLGWFEVPDSALQAVAR